ncbi:MAG: glycosyltransferase family 2 protein [Candidatus Shapirobacteria bacterium]
MNSSFIPLKELSIFFPAYNEEANIENTFNKTLPILKEVAKKWEVIIVNDGSKDKTGQISEAIAKKYPNNVKVVTHNPNRGYGGAFKSGLYNSKYEWIAFTDADGQFDFNDIKTLIETQRTSNSDMVIGYYLGRKVKYIRILGSKMWQLMVYILFGLNVTDTDCGFKLIRKKIVETIPPLVAERGPFINSEFLIQSKKAGFKIVEVGVHHYPRVFGEATGTKLNVVIAGFKDLFSLWFKMTFSK